MNHALLIMEAPFDSIKTTLWYGDRVKFTNNIILRRFNKRINERLAICQSFLREYYKTHNRLDIAYDAIGKLDDYSLLLLCKYVYDVDRAIAFSSMTRLRYFYKYISSVTSHVYSSARDEVIAEMSTALGFVICSAIALFVFQVYNQMYK